MRSGKIGLLVMVAMVMGAATAVGEVTFIAVGAMPGSASDRSGLKGKLPDGTPMNRLGGQGSAIAYSGKGNQYILVPDSGPKESDPGYKCRYHVMNIDVAVGSKPHVKLELASTTMLVNENGQGFVGAMSAIDPVNRGKSLRLDPEGVRVGRNGQVFVSDEFGPFLYEFAPNGKRIRSLAVPDKFLIANVAKTSKDEMPPHNKRGRQANRGLEGLAITPDGSRLVGAMQSPLIQDGGLNAENGRIGINNRLIEWEVATGKTREFVYQLESSKHGVCEITAINDHEFLVLERDSKAGVEAAFKSIFKIDAALATDVSDIESLPTKTLPKKIKPVSKTTFLNLLDPKHKLAGPTLPEKFEGMTFGPDLPDGRRLLLLTVDNDFKEDVPFQVFAFAVDVGDLPSFVPQQFDGKAAVNAR